MLPTYAENNSKGRWWHLSVQTNLSLQFQVLAGLAQQLTSMWNCATNVDSWLPLLLETMLLLTSHPSHTLAHTANSVWLAFLKHDQISKLPHVLAMVPRWLQAATPKILKVCAIQFVRYIMLYLWLRYIMLYSYSNKNFFLLVTFVYILKIIITNKINNRQYFIYNTYSFIHFSQRHPVNIIGRKKSIVVNYCQRKELKNT